MKHIFEGVCGLCAVMFILAAALQTSHPVPPAQGVNAVIRPSVHEARVTRYFVMNCDGETLATIYGDQSLAIPLANPVISDASGMAEFNVAAGSCYEVKARPEP